MVRNLPALIAAIMASVAALLVGNVFGQETVPEEEFVGPFASWHQVRCDGLDDTATLQAAFASVGGVGQSPVVYIQSGTCRITATLSLGPVDGQGKQNITILGADPNTTKIVWAGPAGGTMLRVNGVGHTRYGRLTWDGGGTANAVYELAQVPDTGGYFSTGNRHEDEVFTNLATHAVAVRAGDSGIGDAETEWIRCHFIGPMEVGILLKNFNVGDYWIWDSEFTHLHYGIANTDQPPLDSAHEGGAGWYAVNRSNFIGNDADMVIGNTGFFSSRWNYSRGSGFHVLSNPIGNAASPWTSQGETILDPGHQPFAFGSVGPLGVVDAVIRGGPSLGGISVIEGYAEHPGGDLWALGNTFSNTSPSQYASGERGRFQGYIDDKTGVTITDPGPLTLPHTPPSSSAPVIEVENGDIAAALARAGSDHAIVHMPYGRYAVSKTLEVGPNVILTGDGWGATELQSNGADPIIHLAGPSHAVLRDFSMNGLQGASRIASGIVIDNADQPGGRVHSEQWMSGRNDIGWQVTNLSSTVVDLLDHIGSNNSHVDNNGADPSRDFDITNSKLHIFNGSGAASDVVYAVQHGELVAQTMYYEGNPPGATTHLIQPGSNGTLVLDIGSFNTSGGSIDTSSVTGLFTLSGILNSNTNASTAASSRTFGPNSLVMGYLYGFGTTDTTLPQFTGAPYALWKSDRQDGLGGVEEPPTPEQTVGIADPSRFLREHLAPLRAAVPVALAAQPADVTDVRLHRVGGELLRSGVRIAGSAH